MARRTTRFVRPAPRSNIWLSAGFADVVIGASSVVLLGVLNAAALALRPFTIVRTRMLLHYISDQSAATELSQAVMAMQVVTEVASAGGIGNVPTPITEADNDFFVYQPLFQDFLFVSGVGVQSMGSDQTYVVDSKAMRKVGPGDDVVQTIENRSAVGAAVAAEGRFLVKLH